MRSTITAAAIAIAALSVSAGEAQSASPPDKPKRSCHTPWCEKVPDHTRDCVTHRRDDGEARLALGRNRHPSCPLRQALWSLAVPRRRRVRYRVDLRRGELRELQRVGDARLLRLRLLELAGRHRSGDAAPARARRSSRPLRLFDRRDLLSACGSGCGSKAEYYQRAILHVAPSVTYRQAARAVGRTKIGAG